jgi:2-polyprenyl-3-methyl-5-hydroxy-6-metoxy-1,4-benzoquinol methylase
MSVVTARSVSGEEMLCPSCGSRDLTTQVHAEPHSLYACSNCDLHFFHPARNPGHIWYADCYRLRNISHSTSVGWNHRQFLNDHSIPVGRLLDVGCGTGSFLAAAGRRGFTVTGIDFDETAVREARERFGLSDVHAWTLDNFKSHRPDQQFEVVTAFEVLEHVDQPGALLRECAGLLRAGGYLAVSVPFRDRWPHWEYAWDQPPNHVSRWSRRALATALTNAGFEVVAMRSGWMAGACTMLENVKFGIASRYLERAQLAAADTRRRLEKHASILHTVKTAGFGVVGAPVDVLLRAIGSTGIDLYALARLRQPHQ